MKRLPGWRKVLYLLGLLAVVLLLTNPEALVLWSLAGSMGFDVFGLLLLIAIGDQARLAWAWLRAVLRR